MRSIFFVLMLFVGQLHAQVQETDTAKVVYYLIEKDTVLRRSLELDSVVVSTKYVDRKEENRQKFLLLQRRVLKVYPYARESAMRLQELNTNMAKFKSKRDKNRYFNIVEHYLEKEFKGQLKNLTRKEGQILVKLIHRQTGQTTHELIKDLKSGWSAFWAQNTAKLFDLNLKAEYNPKEVTEDYLIEGILLKAFREGRLIRQNPANPINYKELFDLYQEKMDKNKFN